MIKVWSDHAWEDYLYWPTEDKKILKRINQLIKDIDRNGYESLCKPEPLKYELQGIGAVESMMNIDWSTGLWRTT